MNEREIEIWGSRIFVPLSGKFECVAVKFTMYYVHYFSLVACSVMRCVICFMLYRFLIIRDAMI
jgi:hypothetical protein